MKNDMKQLREREEKNEINKTVDKEEKNVPTLEYVFSSFTTVFLPVDLSCVCL